MSRISRSIFAPFICALVLAVLIGPHRAGAEDCAKSPAGLQAGALHSGGKSEAALPYVHEAMEIAGQQCGARDITIVVLLTYLGAIYQNLGHYAEAKKQLKCVIEIKQAALSPEEEYKTGAALPDMIIDLDNLAFIYGAHELSGELPGQRPRR